MHYLAAQGMIFCETVGFSPVPPYGWSPGDTVSFLTAAGDVLPLLRFCSLLAADGSGWGLELDIRNQNHTGAGIWIASRVMHRITSDRAGQAAILRLALRRSGGLVPLFSRHYQDQGEVNRLASIILESGGRPVIDGNGPGAREGVLADGKLLWTAVRDAV